MQQELVNGHNVRYIGSALASVCEYAWEKCLASFIYVVYAFSFDTLQSQALKALLALLIIDFITGLYASKRSGEEIKSSKIFRTGIKILLYFVMVSAAHLTELAVPALDFMVDETMLGFLALTELVSILENIGRVGFTVPQQLLNKIKNRIETK